jgi:hypothetical protein
MWLVKYLIGREVCLVKYLSAADVAGGLPGWSRVKRKTCHTARPREGGVPVDLRTFCVLYSQCRQINAASHP